MKAVIEVCWRPEDDAAAIAAVVSGAMDEILGKFIAAGARSTTVSVAVSERTPEEA